MICLDEQIKDIFKEFCKSFDVPTIILGSDLICKFCNADDLELTGVHFSSIVASDTEFILGRTPRTMVKVKDKIYCALITAVSDEYYFCQLFDSENLFSMSQLADIYDSTVPTVLASGAQIDEILKKLNELAAELSDKSDGGLRDELTDLIAKSKKTNSRLRELVLYFKLCFSRIGCSYFNISHYVKWAIDKCNSLLLGSGRCIEALFIEEDQIVNAESKFVVFCIIDMIQFSLLYSPIDTNPVIALENNKGNAELTVTCKSSIFIPKGKEYEFLGSITSDPAVVKRVAQRSGAEFEIINDNSGIIGIKVKFPTVDIKNRSDLLFESAEIIDYNDEFSKYAEYKMQEVINIIDLQRSKK